VLVHRRAVLEGIWCENFSYIMIKFDELWTLCKGTPQVAPTEISIGEVRDPNELERTGNVEVGGVRWRRSTGVTRCDFIYHVPRT